MSKYKKNLSPNISETHDTIVKTMQSSDKSFLICHLEIVGDTIRLCLRTSRWKKVSLTNSGKICSAANAHLLLLLMGKSIHDESASTAATCWTFIVTPAVISPQVMAPESRVSNARPTKLN
jgi:fructose-specific component phosphotransferase system IIB-like protein